MAETGLTKNQIISELTRSEHGNLQQYVAPGRAAAKQEPEFYAHLIAWDALKGQIRDAHVALPIISLTTPGFPKLFEENSLAHLALLRPRDFLRAYRFGLDLKAKSGVRKRLNGLVAEYLGYLEAEKNRWDRTAVQHRRTLKELYALAHVKPSARAQRVLFNNNYPPGSVFEKIAGLKDMPALEAAGTILGCRIPFLVAIGALGKKAQDPDLVLALIEQMSATELVTNTKMLEKLGVKNSPVLRAAFDEAIAKAAKSKKGTLKATRAAEHVKDEVLHEKLVKLQEAQLQALGGIEGNWLVLGDKSGSMRQSIEVAQQIAGILTKMVTGKVSLVFFDTAPRFMDVTGKTYEEIKKLCRSIDAGGGTSIGCGLKAAVLKAVDIDGIAVVSDAAENTPPYFVNEYERLIKERAKDVPVYLYRCGNDIPYGGDRDLQASMKANGYYLAEFDVRKGVDFYSLPNLVATMRTNPYSLADEIFATPLLTLSDVLKEDANVS